MFLHKKEITDPFKKSLGLGPSHQPRGRDQHDGAATAPGTWGYTISKQNQIGNDGQKP
jgi:hypothetical protein